MLGRAGWRGCRTTMVNAAVVGGRGKLKSRRATLVVMWPAESCVIANKVVCGEMDGWDKSAIEDEAIVLAVYTACLATRLFSFLKYGCEVTGHKRGSKVWTVTFVSWPTRPFLRDRRPTWHPGTCIRGLSFFPLARRLICGMWLVVALPRSAEGIPNPD